MLHQPHLWYWGKVQKGLSMDRKLLWPDSSTSSSSLRQPWSFWAWTLSCRRRREGNSWRSNVKPLPVSPVSTRCLTALFFYYKRTKSPSDMPVRSSGSLSVIIHLTDSLVEKPTLQAERGTSGWIVHVPYHLNFKLFKWVWGGHWITSSYLTRSLYLN